MAVSAQSASEPRTFQQLILALQQYWIGQGCVLMQPYDMEVGAGTFHPSTFLRAVGPEPWRAAHVQASRRPTDGRYGENPNRLQHYYQFQVLIKPAPLDIQELENAVVVSRWIAGQPAPPYYRDIFGLDGPFDRKQHYECRLPSIAINRSVYAPAGTGGTDENLPTGTLINNSYNFMTPVNADTTLYFWVQHRNARVGDTTVSARMFDGARTAFLEDKAVLEAVHRGMADHSAPALNLGLDAGAIRFRRLVEARIKAETG